MAKAEGREKGVGEAANGVLEFDQDRYKVLLVSAGNRSVPQVMLDSAILGFLCLAVFLTLLVLSALYGDTAATYSQNETGRVWA